MHRKKLHKIVIIAALFAGAAMLLSCKSKKAEQDVDLETLKTQQSNNLTLINTVNGKLQHKFKTALLERFELAKEPYMLFPKGVYVETYNDSTQVIESTLKANYAKFIEHLELWEAKGNVVATNSNGHILETQQLFWDQKSDKIYSNVDSKITQGDNVVVGIGFESNSKFDDFIFRNPRGQGVVESLPGADSTQTTQ